mgnify:CR=1 FL=1|jgi:hypothetical protein
MTLVVDVCITCNKVRSKHAKLQTIVDSMADMLGRLEAISDATFTSIEFDLPPLLDEPKIDEESEIREEE